MNSDIVGKLVNIASRCAGFLARSFDSRLGAKLPETALYDEFAAESAAIGKLYEEREYAAAIRAIMALADRANHYIDQHKPWLLAKDPDRAAEVQAVCTHNLFRVLVVYLKPVLSKLAAKAEIDDASLSCLIRPSGSRGKRQISSNTVKMNLLTSTIKNGKHASEQVGDQGVQ